MSFAASHLAYFLWSTFARATSSLHGKATTIPFHKYAFFIFQLYMFLNGKSIVVLGWKTFQDRIGFCSSTNGVRYPQSEYIAASMEPRH